MVTVGNGIFLAKFLDKKCYAVMADRKKVLTTQGSGIPVSAVGQGGKADPQTSSSSDRTSLANSSKSLMNQRYVACSRFTKSVNKHKKRVESVDEAKQSNVHFLIKEEHFLRAMILRNQATKLQNLRHA